MSEANVFDDVFGVPTQGGGDYLKAVKIPKGITVGRLIPPVKSQKATGKWSLYHAVHYGAQGKNKKDASSTKLWAKPFLCIQHKDMRTQMITQECPKCEQVKAKEAELKAREGEIRAELKGRPEDAVKKALKADQVYVFLKDWAKAHNVDRHHYINLKLVTGEVVTMKIPGKCKKALEEEIKKLRARKVDPFDPKAGVYFEFNRSGEDTETVYTVTVAREEIKGPDGQTYERNKAAPLTVSDVEQIKARAMDLASAHGATSLTEEQIRSVMECDEDPESVDAIFDAAQPAAQEQAKPAAVKPASTPTPAAKPAAKPAPAPAPEPEVVEEPVAEEAPPAEDDLETKLRAQLAELQARKAATAKPVTKPAAVKPAAKPAPAPVQSADEMSPEDFIAEFGDPAES